MSRTFASSEWQQATVDLNGRRLLVCGAHGGLGSATALAAAGAGATVVLLGRQVKAMEKLYDAIVAAGGAEPAIYPLNLEGATPQDYAQLGDTLLAEFGALDGVFFGSARFMGLTPLLQTAPEEFSRVMQVNLTAPLLLLQGVWSALRAAPDPAVVFTLDDPERSEHAFWGAYGVAGAALRSLMAILADENENQGVRVHGLMPGPMRTQLRGRAYYAENPGEVPEPSRYAPAALSLLAGSLAKAHGRILDARAG